MKPDIPGSSPFSRFPAAAELELSRVVREGYEARFGPVSEGAGFEPATGGSVVRHATAVPRRLSRVYWPTASHKT